MDRCAECGFTFGVTPRPELAATLRAFSDDFSLRLDGPPERLRRRRTPEEWSPLEYSCHVRDVLLVQRERLYLALVEDAPSFTPMYRDERVTLDRYVVQAPHVVGEQIVMAAGLFSHALDGLNEAQWRRSLMYGFPDPARRDVEWLADLVLHEVRHHVVDVDRILGESAGPTL
jgi:DinB superfamily